jgi:hypothetical protein
VIRAGQHGGIALVVPAHLHATVPARIEEHVNLLGAVTAEDDRFLAHRRDEEIAGVRDLALVPDKQPGAGEDAFQFHLINLVVYEDLAADLPRYQIDEPGTIT